MILVIWFCLFLDMKHWTFNKKFWILKLKLNFKLGLKICLLNGLFLRNLDLSSSIVALSL